MTEFCDHSISSPENQSILFKKNGYKIIECKTCSHYYAKINDLENHVTTVYSDDYFFEGKAGYPNYLEEKELLFSAGKRYAKIISKYTQPGNLLDVGCAAGFIMKGYSEEGWNCQGVEPNDTMASYGRIELNMNIFTGSLETFKSDQKFDLISLIQVIGHFYNLNLAMQNINDLLNKDGLVLVESWDRESAYAKLMGSKWHEYSPPSVLHWFSDSTIAELFKKHGFTFIAKGYPIKKIKVSHAISLLDEKLPRFIYKKQLFYRITKLLGKASLLYPLHDLKWYLFKKTIAN